MNSMADALNKELNVDTAFTLHLGPVSLPFAESTVISWVVMGILVALALLLTHNLKVENPGRGQLALESFVCWLEKSIKNILGPGAEEYWMYLFTVCLFIGMSNIIGLLGMKPPTKDLDVTVALAVMSIVRSSRRSIFWRSRSVLCLSACGCLATFLALSSSWS